MSLIARRSFTPRIACLATGAVLVVPLVAGLPLPPGSMQLNVAVPNALHNARITLANDVERSLRILDPLADAEVGRAPQRSSIGVGTGITQSVSSSMASLSGVSPSLDSSRTFAVPTADTMAGGVATKPILDTAAIDRFSEAALRVAAAGSSPIQDVQAIAGVLSSLAQSVIESLGTAPEAIQTALGRLGDGDVNGAFSSLESLILTPLEIFAIGQGPQTIADALTNLFPPGAPVFQSLPGITISVGVGLIDDYISTRTTIVDAVTSSIKSLGTLNPLVIAQTIGTGIGKVTAKLFDAAFGPTGIIATLVSAGQQILNALAPQPTTRAVDSGTADTKEAPGATQHGAVVPASTGADEATGVSTPKPDAPSGGRTDGVKDTSSTTSDDTTATASSTGSPAGASGSAGSSSAGSNSVGSSSTSDSADPAGTPKPPTDGASSDPSAPGKPGAPSEGGHTGGHASGSTDDHGDAASSTNTPSSSAGRSPHETTGAPTHTPAGPSSHRPGRNGSAAADAATSKPGHDESHASSKGGSSSAANKSGDA